MIRKTILLFVLIAGTVCGAALAQSVEGRISGTVTDPNDAVVPGVEVIVENEETGVRRQTVSDDQGRYAMPLLQPGRYRVTATLPGFRTYQRTGIIIATSESIVLDFKLELGEVQDTITVSGAAPLLEAGTSDIGQLIEPKTVSDMPLNGRRALNLAQLAGATVWVNYSGNAKPNFSLAGGRTQSQNFSIDGGTGQNMRLGVGQIDTDPPVEAVREFKILASSYSAEYGGSAGGLVIMTTKSGTNDFHGSLFEYFRNDALDAAGFFSPIDARTGEKDKPPLRYNLFGGTIGGPILKNRTHFFGAYEVTRQRVGATQVMTVPTELQRRGDFSQTLNAAGRVIQIYDPSTTRTVSGRAVRDLFSGNRIPANQLDPVALKLLNFWPVPNREASNPAGANNFAANWTELFDRDNVTARVDHVINQRWNLYGRYMYNKDPITQTSVLPDPRADAATIRDRFQHNILVATTYAFRPSIINDLRFTFTTRQNHAKSMGLGGTWDRDLGLKGISGEAFPRINVTGITSIGSAAQERRQFPIRQYHTGDSLTWFHGKHFLKMGGEVRKSTNFEVNRPSISGVFAFGVQPTGLPGTSGTGLGLASFLVGFPNSFNVRETEALDRYSWYLAGFVQDDWKVHPNLTLNIGLRWEVDTPMTDRNQRMNGFDATAINPVSKTPGVVRFSGVDGWPDSSAEPDWNNFGPRVGFAWRPFGSKKTVIRGGGGVFFAHPFDHGAPASAALGFERSANLQTPDNGITAPFLLKDGVPPVQLTGAALTPGFGAVEVGRAATTAVTFYERSRRSGYSQQFNLGVQHEIRGILLEATYLGNLSRKLADPNISINQVTPDKISASSTQRDRPFPQFSNVSIQFPTFGVTNYHAAMFRTEKRFAGGLSFLSTYTLAKNLGTVDSGGDDLGDAQFYQNFYNRHADYGPGGLDVRQRFTWSSVWELPFGHGRRWLSDHPLRSVVGGWTLGAIGILQSGPPFSVNMQTSSVQFLAGPQKPDLLRDPNLPPSKRVPEKWFDTEAFAPPAGPFGNAGNGILRADGDISFDFSLIKNVSFGEERFVQFRLESFNAFNHPNFDLPGHSVGGPGIGIVTSANSGRIVQLGIRAVF